MDIGYTRPTQSDPQCEKQKIILIEKGCKKIISEKHPKEKRRNELEKMLQNVMQGDKIIVTHLYALAGSTHHLVEVLEKIQQKGASLESIREGIDTSTAQGYPFIDIVKHIANFQSDVISEKTKKGMDRARKKGVSPGRPRKPDANVRRAIEMYKSNQYSLAEIRSETGISKSTLYRYLES